MVCFMLRRITSVIMAVVLILTGAAAAQRNVYADKTIDPYKLDMLHAVGILKQEDDYVGGMVMRLEGAETALAMMAVRADSINVKSKFYDIRDYTYESAVAVTANDYRIMQGTDGNFYPENILTFNQAVKIIMTALGYEKYAMSRGGYPEGYRAVAEDVGLFKNIEVGREEGITQDKFYAMVYNAASVSILQAESVDRGNIKYSDQSKQTFLEKYYDIFRVEGKITGNDKTELGSELSAGKSNVKIDGNVYMDGTGNAGNYIGYSVEAYIKQTDSGDQVIWVHPQRKCTAVTVKAEDMEPFQKSDRQLEYKSGNTKKRYRISPVADVIYNGKYCSHPQEFQLNPQNGSIDLIDSDGDGIYECMVVHDYITYRVKNLDTNRKMIFDRYMQEPISLDNAQANITVKKDGTISDFSEISVGDVLLVAADQITVSNDYRMVGKDAGIFEIIILQDEITGKAEKVTYAQEGGTMTTGGKEYDLSAELYMLSALEKKGKMRPGAQYKYILSPDGIIVDFTLLSGEQYGFLCKGIDNREDEKYEIRFFDLDSTEILKRPVAQKLTLNGKQAEYAEVARAFRTNSSGIQEENVVPQLFKYRENNDGEICYIDTWIYNDGAEDAESSLRLSVKGSNFIIKSGKYDMSHKFVMSSNARVLTVRTRKQNGIDKIPDEAGSFVVSDRNIADYWESYNVEAYNCNSAGATDMVVVYKSVDYDYETETEIGGGMMYDSITEVVYDGEVYRQLNGYSPSGPVSMVLDSDLAVKDWTGTGFEKMDLSQLQKGDIIKYQLNDSKCMKLERIFSYTNSEGLYNEYHYYRSYMNVGQSHFSYGKAYAYQDEVMRVKFDTSFDLQDQNSYAVLETQGKDVLVYDTNTGTFETVEPGGLLYAENINDFGDAYDIVFHTHDMRLDAIYAYR